MLAKQARGFRKESDDDVPLELLLEEGWWEVEFEAADKGGNYLVSAKRYKVQHVVQIEKLRPAWRWDEKARQWGILERLTQGKNEKGAPPTKVPSTRSGVWVAAATSSKRSGR